MDSAQTTPKIMDTVEIKPENEVSELENGGVSSEVNDPIMSIEGNHLHHPLVPIKLY